MSGPVSPNPGDVPELWWSPIHGLVREKDGVWARYEEHTVTLCYYGLPNERPADAVRLIPAGQGVKPKPHWERGGYPGGDASAVGPPVTTPSGAVRGQLYPMTSICATCSHHRLQHAPQGGCLRCPCHVFESVTQGKDNE